MATSSDRPNGGPCRGCVRVISWVPVLFIIVILVWSYYAYVIQLCILTVDWFLEKLLYLIGYHFLLMMFIWAYWQTVFTPIGSVPRKFKLSKEDLEKLRTAESEEAQKIILERCAQNLPVTNRTNTGSIRYCEKCRLIKPDRAHHCSVCGECVLKMDHHCPWINNCVSFTNYKFFLLFLSYALLYCLFIVLTSLQYFVQFWRGDLLGVGRFHILFLFFVAAMFAISMVSLFSYHCYLVLRNVSTLEAFRAPIFRTGEDKDGFSLGAFNNFLEVFGDNAACWCFPIFSSLGDGVSFPVRSQHQIHQYNSIGVTHNSFGDGVTFPQRMLDEDTDMLLGSRQRWAEEDSPTHQDLNKDQAFNEGVNNTLKTCPCKFCIDIS